MIRASCHCGAVQIEIDSLPDTLTQCTCSICRRYGALWAYLTRKTARVVAGRQSETPYIWNDKVIEFYHCNKCGCMTRYEDVEKLEDSRVAVNARMIAPEDIAGLRIRTFDGAETWKYLD
jgi:hypothetical protein